MVRRPGALAAVFIAAGALACGRSESSLPADPEHPVVSTLREVPLASFQNQARPGSMADDRGIRLGGFSDLYHDPRDAPDVFWTVPGRGPTLGDSRGRTFLVPDYNPALVKLLADPSGMAILEQIPIVTPGGRPVSGLPNEPGGEGPAVGPDGEALAFNPNGLDPEGLVRVPDGTFWLAERYGPSLVHLARDGRVLERWMPRGSRLAGAAYPVTAVLPAALARRAPDQGLESLAVTTEGRFLYSMMAGPLAPAGAASRPIRILEVDTLLARPVSEWLYLPEAADDDASGERARVSALSFVNGGTLLAVETTAKTARVFALDLAAGTNVLGGAFDSPGGPILDALDAGGLARAGVSPVARSFVLDLGRLPAARGRIAGLAIVDADTVAVTRDDGFGLPPEILGFDRYRDPTAARPGPSRVVTIRLGAPLPLGR